MRRRFQGRRRFPNRPVMRQQLIWNTINFNETAMDQTGIINEQVLFDPLTDVPYANSNLTTRIKRVIGHGAITFLNESAVFQQDTVSIFQAVYVLDREDTDATIVTTTSGGIYETARILWSECDARTLIEDTDHAQIREHVRIDFDLTVGLKLRQDEIIVHAMQLGNDVTATAQDVRLSMTSRTLWVR